MFHFMFYFFHLTILNLIKVSKVNLQLSCLPAFSYPPLQFKLEEPSMEKLKF